MYTKFKHHRSATVFMTLVVITMTLLCSCDKAQNSNPETESTKNEDVTTVIKSVFDSRELKYSNFTEDDGTVVFTLKFKDDDTNLIVGVGVYVLPESYIYHIIGSTNIEIDPGQRQRVLNEINEYNEGSSIASCFLSDKGELRFWVGRNIEGCAFSKDAFAADFNAVVKDTAEETPKIIK